MKRTFCLLLLIIPFFYACSDDDKDSNPIQGEWLKVLPNDYMDNKVVYFFTKDFTYYLKVYSSKNEIIDSSSIFDYSLEKTRMTLTNRETKKESVAYYYFLNDTLCIHDDQDFRVVTKLLPYK